MSDGSRAAWSGTVGVGVLFASNGALFAGLLPWYPLLTGRLGLTATQFGLVVASFAVGALASSALPPRLIARLGPVRVSLLGTVVLAAAVAAVAWAPAGWAFALALFVAGFVDAIVDVAQNVAGVRVQDPAGRPILSSMHALWSLGGVASGALSTVSAASGVDARLHLAILAVAGIVLVTLGGRLIGPLADDPPVDASASPSEAWRRRWRSARLPGVGQGGGVTIISWLMRVGFLATSPIIGAVTDAAGLRWGMGILIPIGVTAVALAGALDRDRAR